MPSGLFLLFYGKEGNYLSYITNTGNYLARGNLKECLGLLPKTAFIQIHRSYVVAIRNIEKVENNHVHTGNESLPIGASYREALFTLLEAPHRQLK